MEEQIHDLIFVSRKNAFELQGLRVNDPDFALDTSKSNQVHFVRIVKTRDCHKGRVSFVFVLVLLFIIFAFSAGLGIVAFL